MFEISPVLVFLQIHDVGISKEKCGCVHKKYINQVEIKICSITHKHAKGKARKKESA